MPRPRVDRRVTPRSTQVVITILLPVSAGLFVRTLSNLHSIELGINHENLLLFELDAQKAGYEEPRQASLRPGDRTTFTPPYCDIHNTKTPLLQSKNARKLLDSVPMRYAR